MLNKIISKCKACVTGNIYINEMQTKTSIILPFFQYLGYDTEDFFMFKAEYSCGRERVDYAILNNNKVEVLIETKKISESLNNHVSQISKYMKYHKEANLGILTNGVEYRFYKRKAKGLLEVWRLNLLSLTNNDLNILNNCKKSQLKSLEKDSIIKYSRLDLTLRKLFEKPSDELLEIIRKSAELDNLRDWEIQSFLADYTVPKKTEAPTKKISDEEKKDILLDKNYKSLILKGFSKEEATWLVKYKNENNFDLYKSIRFYLNRGSNTHKEFILSDLMKHYASKDIKLNRYVLNNKHIFASICNRLIPEIRYSYQYIDDISSKTKIRYIDKHNETKQAV